jgi:hypothetical protein
LDRERLVGCRQFHDQSVGLATPKTGQSQNPVPPGPAQDEPTGTPTGQQLTGTFATKQQRSAQQICCAWGPTLLQALPPGQPGQQAPLQVQSRRRTRSFSHGG